MTKEELCNLHPAHLRNKYNKLLRIEQGLLRLFDYAKHNNSADGESLSFLYEQVTKSPWPKDVAKTVNDFLLILERELKETRDTIYLIEEIFDLNIEL